MTTQQSEQQNNAFSFIAPIISFIAILVFIYIQGWHTKDLVWGLWFSSLVVGYITILCVIYAQSTIEHPSVSPILRTLQHIANLGGAAFMLVFFTIHFGMFHVIHSLFLQIFFPVEGTVSILGNFFTSSTADQAQTLMSISNVTQGEEVSTFASGLFSFLPDYKTVILAYWPIALITLIATLPALRDGLKKKSLSFATPYSNVVKLHLTIFVLAFLSFTGLEQFWLFALIFSIFYFPWSSLAVFARKPATVATQTSKSTLPTSIPDTESKLKDPPFVQAPKKSQAVKLEESP
ncbi:MAG TPA: DUF6498-containing protein [Acidobacteriota bacterium]|nr:DUF6498-containing protein [Acidobacteriota bacterium]